MAMDWNLTIGGAQWELQGLDRIRAIVTSEAERVWLERWSNVLIVWPDRRES